MTVLPDPVSRFVIAIDGPSGTGKSTVARGVAIRLGAGYLDTGALYRTVALAVLRAGVDPNAPAEVAKLLPDLTFDPPLDPARQVHRLAGQDVSQAIRGPEVTLAVTPVSANPAVRAHLLARQRELAHSGRMVVEGRDIGTVIAPDAQLKVYLTAEASVRAGRRLRQHAPMPEGSGGHSLETVAADLARRDHHDATREHAPLAAADDAVVLDSTALDANQTIDRVLELAAARGIS